MSDRPVVEVLREPESAPDISVVILTMGDRPRELRALIESVVGQEGVSAEVVVVLNGCAGAEAPTAAHTVVRSASNVGIAAGRDLGLRASSAQWVAFLDDDGELGERNVFCQALGRFEADPAVAVVAMRIRDASGQTARRHVPRLGRRGVLRPGFVAGFLGGASIVRRRAYLEAGGYDHRFFYAMEETDLAWRLIDHGWSIWYEPACTLVHPQTSPRRHPGYQLQTARNRCIASRKSLPWPLLILYLSSWLVIPALRDRQVVDVLRGYAQGLQSDVRREPIRWATCVALTRLGRPPIV